MAKIKIDPTADFKKQIKEKTLVLGEKKTMAAIKQSKISKVYLTNNCSRGILDNIKYYNSIADFEVVTLPISADESGAISKKKYPISIAGLIKAK